MRRTKTIVLPEFNLAYVNSPRNGCTSIKTVFLDVLDIDFKKTAFDTVHQLFYSGAFPGQLVNGDLRALPDRFKVFTIVRNPFDRFVSGFQGKIKDQVAPDIRNYYQVENDISFKDFAEKMDHLGIDNFEVHFCEQFRGFQIPQVDKVIHFENLSKEIEPILDHINYKKNFPHLNKSNHESYKNYYDDESRRWVAKLYEKDLKNLNYAY